MSPDTCPGAAPFVGVAPGAIYVLFAYVYVSVTRARARGGIRAEPAKPARTPAPNLRERCTWPRFAQPARVREERDDMHGG